MKHRKGLPYVIQQTIQKNKGLALGLIFTIVGAIVFTLLPPLVLEKIVNKISDGESRVLSLAICYFLALIIAGLFDASKEFMITVFGQKVTRGLRHEMCGKLSRLQASYFVQNEAGKTTSRFVNDVDTVESLFSNGVVSMFVDGCKVLSIILVIWTKSLGLGILMLLVTPLLFLLTRFFQKRMLKAQLQNRVAIGKVNNQVPETITNIRMIRSFHKQKYMEQRYDTAIQESYHAVEKSNLYDSIYSPIIITVSAILVAVMMILSATGGTMQLFFGMKVGTAVAIIAYVGKVFDPLEAIGMEIQNIQSAVAGVARINEFLEEPEIKAFDTETGKNPIVLQTEKGIRIDDVDFAYEEGKNILNHLSLQIKAGENVTLMGRTGAGKSTIFRLLLGLYEPENGKVLIFGCDAVKIPSRERRRLFGYVEQNFTLIPGTVRDQITLFDDELSSEQVECAVKLAGIHKHILSLSNGYDTVCQMQLFSQGQLQLLSIARAVVSNPQILLLDEMTANLDSATEQQVMSALREASKNRTVISISHRTVSEAETRIITI